MLRVFRKSLTIIGTLFVLAPWVSVVMAGSTDSDPTTATDVQRELKETLQTITSYSAEQRNIAVAKAKEALDKTDMRIDQLQQQVDQNLKPISQDVRRQTLETLKTLRKQRTEIAEWVGGMKHSSTSAWGEIKKGFAKSYTELQKSLEKAREKF